MKSKLYKKHHASKYKFPTHVTKGNGNTKGKLNIGAVDALYHLEQVLKRKLIVVRTMHTKHEWVFCEARA